MLWIYTALTAERLNCGDCAQGILINLGVQFSFSTSQEGEMGKPMIMSCLFAALLTVASIGNAYAELVIIVNSAYQQDLTIEEVRDFYLGQSQGLKPVDQAKGSPDRVKFLEAVIEMSESKFKNHWARLIFSGRGRPPNTLSSPLAVISFVASNPKAIGYVDADLIKDQSIKIVLRVE